MLDTAHSLIPGWSIAINDDVTESTPYMFGHVACAIAFPEVYNAVRQLSVRQSTIYPH